MLKSALCPFVLEFSVEKQSIYPKSSTTETPSSNKQVEGATEEIDIERKRSSSVSSKLDRCVAKGCGAKFKWCNCKKCAECGYDVSGAINSRERHHCRDCGMPVCPCRLLLVFNCKTLISISLIFPNKKRAGLKMTDYDIKYVKTVKGA